MKIVKIFLGLVLSMYLTMGLLAGLFITSSVGVGAQTAIEIQTIENCIKNPTATACETLAPNYQVIVNKCRNNDAGTDCSKYESTIISSCIKNPSSTSCESLTTQSKILVSKCIGSNPPATCASLTSKINQITSDPKLKAEFCKNNPQDIICVNIKAAENKVKTGSNSVPTGTAIGVDLNDAIGFKACNISGQDAKAGGKLQECVKGILQFAVILAGIIAIIQLGVAAFNYFNPEVSSDTLKSSIDSIRNIFIGLMLIIAPIIILRTFNVSLTNFGFLGFTASSPTSDTSKTASNTTGTNATADKKQIGNIALSPTDTKANIETLKKELTKKGTPDFNQADFQNALNVVLSDAAASNLDAETRKSLAAFIVEAQKNNFIIPQDVLARLNSSGTNPDGNQTAQASYCNIDLCTILGAQILTGPNNSYQILTVNLKDKNTNSTNFTMYLRPINQIPSPVNSWIALPSQSAATNQAATVTKNSINGPEFTQWCNAAQTQPGGTGGTACFKSPASSTDLYLEKLFDFANNPLQL